MRTVIFLMYLGLGLFPVASSVAQEPPKKLALLVGVADYFNKRLSDLDYADADVTDVGKELKRLGFEVTLLTEKQATHKRVSSAIKSLVEKSSDLESDSIVFMMFSGHGQELTDAQIPFYLPRDAKPFDSAKHSVKGKSESELAAEFKLIPLNKLIKDINDNSNSSNNLLVFDACRNDPGTGKSSGATKITRNVENGTCILFSATSGQKSWESAEVQHGVMSHFLIEGLQGSARNRRNLITWQNLVTHVRESVSYDAGKLAGGDDRLQSPHAIINQNATIVLGTAAAIDYTEADLDRIEADAFSNYPDAQYQLGMRYADGVGKQKDELEAERWFKKASNQNHMAAKAQLGVLLLKENPETAIELFKSAAASGDAVGQLQLGKACRDGKQVPKDYKKALEWFLKAAKQGNAEAQNQVGIRYADGQGTSKNKTEAAKWYRRSAEQGYSWGQYNLGKQYRDGGGVIADSQQAFNWFLKAAEQGIAGAQIEVGSSFFNGKHVQKDQSKALKWYLKAADQGNAHAQNVVGIRYHNGEGTTKDRTEANKWFLKAAKQDYAWAQYNLAENYRDGLGTTKNQSLAFEWFLKAANNGHAKAQDEVGDCYDVGRGVEKNIQTALSWYTKSANQGNASAQSSLAIAYINGLGVAKDGSKGFKWSKKSAENGNAYGQYLLGFCYQNGKGVTANEALALKWFRKSAAQGNSLASRELPIEVGDLAKELTGKDMNYSKISLSDHRGKIVLLDFWNPG